MKSYAFLAFALKARCKAGEESSVSVGWLILEIIFAVIAGMLLIEGLERGRWYLSQRRRKRR
jgi:hypothetical protein